MENDMPTTDSFSLSHFVRSAVGLFKSPAATFQSMSKDGGYGKPIVYALLWQYMAAALALVLSFVRPSASPWGVGGNIAAFVFMPVLTIAAGFVFAGIFFVIWHLMGSSHNYHTSFRLWALLAPLSVVSTVFRLVPYLSLIVTLYYLYLLVVASVQVHAIRPTRAWTVWSLLLAGFIFILVLAGVVGTLRGQLPAMRSGIPGMDQSAPRLPGQGMIPPDLKIKVEEELARSQAEFERMQKETTAPKTKKGSVKK